MAIVLGKQARWRSFAAHAVMWVFIALTLFPLLAVVSISLRPGNFATGSLIPDTISWEHWRLALGFSVEHADGRVTPPPFFHGDATSDAARIIVIPVAPAGAACSAAIAQRPSIGSLRPASRAVCRASS